MMRIVALLLALIASTGAGAQQAFPLYPGNAPGTIVTDDKEVFSRPTGGRPFVTNVTKPTLTVFQPAKQDAARTAIVICPGGGYSRLSIEDGGYEAARLLADSGITAFVLKYRTWRDSAYTDYRQAPMQDLQQALHMIHSMAAKMNIDTTHIGLLGFSAGGHLVAMSATALTGIRPAFTLLAYPVISFTDSLTSRVSSSRRTLLGGSISPEDKVAFSPELHVTRATPPAFLVQAEDDSTSLVGNSLAYYHALVAHRVPAQLLLYQKGGHGFALHNKVQDEYWMPAALRWLALNGFYKTKK
ncbi:MAG: alpha/beta hydrolase [Bacteroidetes bacterium]|nr:alpha/beta hydrolase [Bacteroidota bacterium]